MINCFTFANVTNYIVCPLLYCRMLPRFTASIRRLCDYSGHMQRPRPPTSTAAQSHHRFTSRRCYLVLCKLFRCSRTTLADLRRRISFSTGRHTFLRFYLVRQTILGYHHPLIHHLYHICMLRVVMRLINFLFFMILPVSRNFTI